MTRAFAATVLMVTLCVTSAADNLAEQARSAMLRAARFMDENAATNGGYLWWYSTDFTERWGEGKATADQVWVQAATPAFGTAYLTAYQATGESYYLELAKKAADALCYGQLQCGGWDYRIDFSDHAKTVWYYRFMAGTEGLDTGRLRNTGTFDDNNTQSAMRLLMAVDEALEFAGPYHDPALYGLDYMMKAQFENGAWPQRFPLAAKGYSTYYTFNDNAMNDCISVMLMAWRTYGDERYRDSAAKGGDFIIASQGPEPQAGWAQQYDWDLKPAGARKFEPPSYCPAVTARNIRTLVALYLALGDEKYMAPIAAALQWLDEVKIADNLWPRFLEVGTNKPLYFNTKYELVSTDDDLPTHYSFKGSYGVRTSRRLYEAVQASGRGQYLEARDRPLTPAAAEAAMHESARSVTELIAALDEEGRWVDDGRIQTRRFLSSFRILTTYADLARTAEAP